MNQFNKHSSELYKLVDFVSKKEVDVKNLVFTGENPWEVVMNLPKIQSRINKDYFKSAPPYVSKYLPLMPVRDYRNFVSLQEGSTPLIQSKVLGPELGIDLYFKLESQNPTGSFKDRGSAVELTVAKELGAKAIAVASTGNMAASCSCYAAAAQLPCFIFIPEDTPASKISQSIAYGGRIVQVKGSYNDAAVMARAVAEKLGFYLAGDYAYRVEGHKTAAFELLEQMYFNAPDYILVPVGCGTNIASYAKGFEEYKELGFINSSPKLVALQAEEAAPVVKSFLNNHKTVSPVTVSNTIAGAIGIGDPIDGIKALNAVYDSGGFADSLTDREMLEAQYRLSKEEGMFVEASCATSLACLLKEGKNGRFSGKKVVCVLTGGGLKDPTTILKIAIKPPTIYPEVDNFLNLYESKFFEGKTVSFTDKDTVLFKKNPTISEISKVMESYFENSWSEPLLKRIQKMIENFLLKGKELSFSDLQDIAQDVLEAVKPKSERSLSITDFNVTTSKDKKPSAKVEISIDGSEYSGEAEGVGPVDALISALRKAGGSKIDFNLLNYHVDIRSRGTNAVVYVEMKLKRGNQTSLGTGTSPDIIQASIEAFEESYNSL